ncbi:MAG: DUF4032 domain-containing protein [Anaerolineales bacterium]|nr:DUF4032 domain-containing protein [Anaerolineales bacterium]
MISYPSNVSLRPGYPDFMDLPWNLPLNRWEGQCQRLEQLPRGLSRHPVVFVNYDGVLYALKELPVDLAAREYDILMSMENNHLPAVTPVGHIQAETAQGKASILITRFLERSLPYRLLFMSPGLKNYREHLLDAMAGLLVQLHLAGVYWGDCSLSNTLFRRDAGTLQAYLVDAETSECCSGNISAMLRFQDLEIMEENVNGDLFDLLSTGELALDDPGVPIASSGTYIRIRYQRLWEEITREEIIHPDERYRIHEKVRRLNEMGFSVRDIELSGTESGDRLRLRAVVTDRNFHRDQLHSLTGMDVEEMQARKMMNEIQEVRATLSRESNRSTPTSVAAYHWLEHIYKPSAAQLEPLVNEYTTLAELYCQVLEHKWYLSEKARHDVGHQMATQDYITCFGAAAEG